MSSPPQIANCNRQVGRGNAESMVDQILAMPPSTKIILLAPIVENRKGEHRVLFRRLSAEGFARVRIDGVIHELADVQKLSKHKKHNIEVVIDRLVVKRGGAFRKRLTDSVELALRFGSGHLIAHILDREDIRLLKTLAHLRDIGNTVLIVEHDRETIETADWIIDLGPDGGNRGGHIVAEGAPEKVARMKKSYTGRYLREILDHQR